MRQFFTAFFLTIIFLFPGKIFAVDNTSKNNIPHVDLRAIHQFVTSLSHVKNYYVESTNNQKLFKDAMNGMLAGLDSHSSYLDEGEYKLLKDKNRGEFIGLGMEVTLKDNLVEVISPIEGTPAAKAGIAPGDIILAIDGNPLTTTVLNEAVQKLRGIKGSTVTLTIIDKEHQTPKKVVLTRTLIPMISVRSKLLPEDIGYIHITYFRSKTIDETVAAIRHLKLLSKGHLKGLIIDLRNNPGGLLESSMETTDLFLDGRKLGKNKMIVYTKGRAKDADSKSYASSGEILDGLPMAVLINRGSASGSEVMAGALQDHKRAIIIGEKSYGKGSVQSIIPLDKTTAIKLTIALYYTPFGRKIQDEGIIPDIVVVDKNPLNIGLNLHDDKSLFTAWEKLKD